MSTTFGALVTLAATLAVFGLLAMLVQAVRTRRLAGLFGTGRRLPTARRLGVEEMLAIDPKRRLLLIRCDEQRILLLTGGPADLILGAFAGVPA